MRDGDGTKEGKHWLRLSQPLLRILAHSTSQTCKPVLRVLAHQFGKEHAMTALPAGRHVRIPKQTIHHHHYHPHLHFLQLKSIHEKSQDFTDPLSFFNTVSLSAEAKWSKILLIPFLNSNFPGLWQWLHAFLSL